MYENIHDIEQKLHNTVIIYKGRPIFVKGPAIFSDAPEQYGIKVAPIPVKSRGGDIKCVAIDDPELDFRSASSRVGYMNFEAGWTEAVWICRKAVRKTIQGLSQYNMMVDTLPPSPRHELPVRGISWHDVITQQGFVDMMMGVYLPISEIEKRLKTGTVVSLAVSKNFAFSHRVEGVYGVEYKGRQIGTSPNLKTFTLMPEFQHFGEIVEHNFANAA